jgi:hypothetical protein
MVLLKYTVNMEDFFVTENNINGWLIFWMVLLFINFVSYAYAIILGDIFSGILSAFMVLYCSIGVWRNFNKITNDER